MAIVNPSDSSFALSGHHSKQSKDAGSLTDAPHSSPLAVSQTAPIPVKRVSYAAAKRAFDLVFCAFFFALFWWLYLICLLLIKLTSRGPVFFKQTRIGQGGRPFVCYKFRSMCVDAENRRQHLDHLNEMSGPVFKMKNDPRMTSVGKWLRKLSLDELPQVYNILIGDMTVVGPRPPVPNEVAQYGPRELGRLAVKPGLTCLWQINGRSNIAFEHWVELDLMYIDTMSFWNDVKIVAKTVPAVITCRGAH